MALDYKMPETTEWAKQQNLHQPTLEYGREIYETVKKFQPKYEFALEVGCAWGRFYTGYLKRR